MSIEKLSKPENQIEGERIIRMDSKAMSAENQIDLTEAVDIVHKFFGKICSGFISFSVIAAINEKSLRRRIASFFWKVGPQPIVFYQTVILGCNSLWRVAKITHLRCDEGS